MSNYNPDPSPGSKTPTKGPPDFFFGMTPEPSTPSTRAPPNPFASNSNPFFSNFPSAAETTASEQPSAKRKRIEIEPIVVQPRTDNVFFTMPPLTPTSPMVATPSCPFPKTPTTPTGPTTPQTPFGLSGFTEEIDQIMTINELEPAMSDGEVQAFVDMFTQDRVQDFLPSFHFDANELQDGSPSAIVKSITESEKKVERLRTQLDHLRYEQRQIAVPVPQNEFDKLRREINNLQQESYQLQEELQHILALAMLSPTHLQTLFSLTEEIEFLFTKLGLYSNELFYIASGQSQELTTPPCFATLLIKKQPFPKSIKQNIKTTTSASEDIIVVELINAPKSDCKAVGKVKAEMSLEENQNSAAAKKSKRNSLTIQNDQQVLGSSGTARFPDLRFMHGTRLKIATLKFTIEVQYIQANGTLHNAILESNKSNPFVVMTNENQWESSAGNLLKFYVFQNLAVAEVPWCRFANYLQNHYLRATRQDLASPARPLSRYDLDYIQVNQFGGAQTVTVHSFTKFWDWFGKVMHSIRHQKPFLFLWLNGLVYGFISKADAERLLQGQPVGTFVTRFSERRAGQVAIAFSKEDPITKRISIKHYLFDTQTNQIKSLPDFCKEKVNLLYLPRLKTEYFSMTGNIHSIVHKDEVFGEYYSTPQVDPLQGYVPDV